MIDSRTETYGFGSGDGGEDEREVGGGQEMRGHLVEYTIYDTRENARGKRRPRNIQWRARRATER